MMPRGLILLIGLVLALTGFAAAQGGSSQSIKASPAYAEVLLRKTDVLADLDAFGQDYTDSNPKMLDLRAELASLNASIDKLLAVRPTQLDRLTSALGKLMVRKAALDAELGRVSRTYAKDHPDYRRAQRRADLYDASITEILKQ